MTKKLEFQKTTLLLWVHYPNQKQHESGSLSLIQRKGGLANTRQLCAE